jgi:hypothetical protein
MGNAGDEERAMTVEGYVKCSVCNELVPFSECLYVVGTIYDGFKGDALNPPGDKELIFCSLECVGVLCNREMLGQPSRPEEMPPPAPEPALDPAKQEAEEIQESFTPYEEHPPETPPASQKEMPRKSKKTTYGTKASSPQDRKEEDSKGVRALFLEEPPPTISTALRFTRDTIPKSMRTELPEDPALQDKLQRMLQERASLPPKDIK